MNTRKTVVLVAVIIIALMGLFPPWRVSFKARSERASLPVGYAFILQPPPNVGGIVGIESGHAVWSSVGSVSNQPTLAEVDTTIAQCLAEVRIDVALLLIQWAIVAILAWGIAYALEPRRKASP